MQSKVAGEHRQGPHPWLLGCVFSWQSQPNKKHNMAGPALPSSLLGGRLVRFDHVFWAHHSGLACCLLCDKPSEYSDLSWQLHGLEERQERAMETRRAHQCKFCWQILTPAAYCLWIQQCLLSFSTALWREGQVWVLCPLFEEQHRSHVAYVALPAIKPPVIRLLQNEMRFIYFTNCYPQPCL